MTIGLDLDNTIICYDRLFYDLARERNFIPPGCPPFKADVCAQIREGAGEAAWRELQSLAYGSRLGEAEIFPDALEVLGRWRRARSRIVIISHKTRFSPDGVELRGCALEFLRKKGIVSMVSGVYFADGAAEKIAMIAREGCRVFVDDLPDILFHPSYPKTVGRVFFSPGGQSCPGLKPCSDWLAVEAAVNEYRLA